MKRNVSLCGWVCLLALFLSGPAKASVVIGATRVVYPASERDVSIKLTNNGSSPALVQAWVDAGDPAVLPENSDAPFVLTPPVSRLDPSKGQTLRLMFTGAELPQDKESLFWLNILEVPPVSTSGVETELQLAFRSRIKIFFRPDNLSGAVIDAPKQLRWQVKSVADGWVLEGYNPTPYYITLVKAGVVISEKVFSSENGEMLSPGGKATFSLKGLPGKPSVGTQVDFTVINDFGGGDAHKSKLEQ
ncbi:fimbria/pilus periplasmic chaperone [Pseudomonas sp. B329]|uniref:fimbrial biogenesis chaperone n=1 Tax=Pseudomonas sp. B329 TaxID=1553459 RepID=UPI00200366C8|nr:fimbria/pilus periplasmic chaperone [Pseudomonas sp. B329]MCK3863817.1 molecular chaperone [Pseudomonas sp. B329]